MEIRDARFSVPITVLSGILGAGKTTLLNRVLNNREGRRVAVIVDDWSEVKIDTDLVRADAELGRWDEPLGEMSNGCICCTLRGDLLDKVRQLAAEGRFDYLLIESTAFSEPVPVAATLDFRDVSIDSLSYVSRPDTVVTVVDTVNLLKDFSSHDFRRYRGEVNGDERTIAHLLTDQMEFADVVILIKVADAKETQGDAVRKIIHSLNADAKIIETNHSEVVAEKILDTDLFDFDIAHEHPMWAKELYGFADYVPDIEEYDVASHGYCARQQFVPEEILAVLNGDIPGMIGAKGHFWIVPRPEWGAKFSLAGSLSSAKPFGTWWANVLQDRWPDHDAACASTQPHWQEPRGDRWQELVFIDSDTIRTALKTKLDACFAQSEMAVRPKALPLDLLEPFPGWRSFEDVA